MEKQKLYFRLCNVMSVIIAKYEKMTACALLDLLAASLLLWCNEQFGFFSSPSQVDLIIRVTPFLENVGKETLPTQKLPYQVAKTQRSESKAARLRERNSCVHRSVQLKLGGFLFSPRIFE